MNPPLYFSSFFPRLLMSWHEYRGVEVCLFCWYKERSHSFTLLLPRRVFCWGRVMPNIYIGVVPMLERTYELMNMEGRLPPAPMPVVYPKPSPKKIAYPYRMTAAQKRLFRKRNKPLAVFDPIVLFGPINRPTFIIPLSDLPY